MFLLVIFLQMPSHGIHHHCSPPFGRSYLLLHFFHAFASLKFEDIITVTSSQPISHHPGLSTPGFPRWCSRPHFMDHFQLAFLRSKGKPKHPTMGALSTSLAAHFAHWVPPLDVKRHDGCETTVQRLGGLTC